MDLGYFRKINNAHAIRHRKDIDVYNNKRKIASSFMLNPLAYTVEVNEISKKLWILPHIKKDICKLTAHPYEKSIESGELVYWNDDYWLITEAKPHTEIISQGTMERCNQTLKWIDDNGDIQAHPTVFYYNARSNFGIEEGKVMNLPAGRRQTVVQLNEHTRKLKRDDRFIFGSEVFKVIDDDYVSDEGLVNLSLQSDQIDPVKDNLELGIADYNRYTPYGMRLLNDQINSIGINQTIQLNVEVKKGDKIISNPSIEFIVINKEIGDVDSTGLFTPKQVGETEITINYKGISTNLMIVVVDSISNDYSVTITGNDSIKSGREGVYTCEFYLNGSPWQDEGLFVLSSDDGVTPSKFASIVSQGNNKCTIKAASNIDFTKIRVPLYVQLNVQNLNGLSVGNKRIKIVPLM
ncbi:hypothetical protein [Paenibacillus sp. QZ-Y1]|uniref:hypothetical protein n=1 Tax=Paenibacillus sp. QZ-Y1 TaxID=3414511 RepID=UPI003F7AB239